jgi:transposase
MIHVQPSLIEPEVQTLEILTQRAVGRVAERAWFVLMSNQGKSVAEICQTFQRGPNCVRKWIKRYNSYGIVGLYDTPRTGRPPKINPQMKPQIDADLQKSPLEKGFFAGFWTLPLLVIHCLNQFTMRLSQPTLRNLLYDLGYRCRRPRLAASRVDLLAAEKLSAIGQVFATLKENGVILYHDETTFRLLPLIRRMWMKIGEQVRIITPSGWNRRFSVFGALNAKTGQFVTAFFEKANSESFIAFLEQLLVTYPTQHIFLLLDNASYHRSHRVMDWVLNQPRLQLLFLPKNDPQLNPVEKIWWRMKDIVAANRSYQGLK